MGLTYLPSIVFGFDTRRLLDTTNFVPSTIRLSLSVMFVADLGVQTMISSSKRRSAFSSPAGGNSIFFFGFGDVERDCDVLRIGTGEARSVAEKIDATSSSCPVAILSSYGIQSDSHTPVCKHASRRSFLDSSLVELRFRIGNGCRCFIRVLFASPLLRSGQRSEPTQLHGVRGKTKTVLATDRFIGV